MKFALGEFVLDTTQRTLSKGDDAFAIRPKTLEVLVYLAEHHDQIVSKEELLETLWPNVTVDEGVVFQSITEIRKLFANAKIVVNFPKRGYQFTEPLVPLQFEQHTRASTASSGTDPETPSDMLSETVPETRKTTLIKLISFLLIFLGIVFVVVTEARRVDEVSGATSPSKYQERILILPVESKVAYSDTSWAGMSGMEQIASRLQGDELNYIYSRYDISTLMHQLAGNNAQGNKRQDDIQFSHIGSLSGATVVVETDVYGGVSNYNLVYKLHTNNKVIEGALFDTSIDGAFAQLVAIISDFVSIAVNKRPLNATEEFNDALFAKALIAYESDWKSSVSFFETYLKLNPDSVIARIYLSRLYLWDGRINHADDIISNTVVSQSTVTRQQALIKFINGRIAAQRSNWALAEQQYKSALALLNKTTDWSLKGDILQHKANVYEQQNKLSKALATLQTALSYYQFIESPIGINTIRLHLSRVYQKQGNVTEARALFMSAKQAIEDQKLVFLDSLLAEVTLLKD